MPKLMASIRLSRSGLLWAAAWLLLLGLAYGVLRPGLSGGFQFDDFVNLPALGATGPIDDAATLSRYLTSGTADPTGRPLALLSFLIDARDWPADASRLLHTNVLLHLLNGSLLLVLLLRLERILEPEWPSRSAAVLAASLWLLHPLLVSTTLYVVQREAMLAATFVLAAILLYLHGRSRLANARNTSLVIMGAAVVGGTVTASLCKANGILLPLLILVLEATILHHRTTPAIEKRFRNFRIAFLVLPSLFVAAYLVSFIPYWNELSTGRDWTVGDRTLTQARAIVDYFRLLAIPSSMSTGLYNDGYVPSRGLLQPATTLLAVLSVLGIAVGAWLARARLPALSASVLFFLAGHTLESSLLPLELYFEHRNYLPALLFFWPISRALVKAPAPSMARIAAATLLIGLFAATTYQRAILWGQPTRMALLWAEKNPDSSRSQSIAAQAELASGNADRAVARLRPLWRSRPEDPQLGLNYINAACAAGGLATADRKLAQSLFARADIGVPLIRGWLERAIGVAAAGNCPGVDLATVEGWISASIRGSPKRSMRSAAPLLAMLALEKNRLPEAIRHFRTSLDIDPSPENAAGQVAVLASRGNYAQALRQLDYYEAVRPRKPPEPGFNMTRVHAWVLERQDYWPKELRILRKKLEAELVHGSNDARSH